MTNLTVENVVRTYAARLVNAYPDVATDIAEERDEILAALSEPAPSVERLLDAVRAYGDARADVAYGRATRKAIDLAWDRVLSAGHIPPLGVRSEPAPSGLDAAARVVADIAVGVCNDWMGDPDHGFVLDPLALPVDAYILARLAARDAALRASTPGDEEP